MMSANADRQALDVLERGLESVDGSSETALQDLRTVVRNFRGGLTGATSERLDGEIADMAAKHRARVMAEKEGKPENDAPAGDQPKPNGATRPTSPLHQVVAETYGENARAVLIVSRDGAKHEVVPVNLNLLEFGGLLQGAYETWRAGFGRTS